MKCVQCVNYWIWKIRKNIKFCKLKLFYSLMERDLKTAPNNFFRDCFVNCNSNKIHFKCIKCLQHTLHIVYSHPDFMLISFLETSRRSQWNFSKTIAVLFKATLLLNIKVFNIFCDIMQLPRNYNRIYMFCFNMKHQFHCFGCRSLFCR